MAKREIPIPQIARTAVAMANQAYQAQINELSRQTALALGVDPSAAGVTVHCDFDTGVMTVTTPDVPVPFDPLAHEQTK